MVWETRKWESKTQSHFQLLAAAVKSKADVLFWSIMTVDDYKTSEDEGHCEKDPDIVDAYNQCCCSLLTLVTS